ncbi:RICIN domain-containing protein [Paenibacillaceae bacterium WGS1546]|uniref:RICIN domain-containing protein n=1 Tax=Cohnella sp. WGS1546 TaxID=3366810 RepID=UPI00372D4988
MKLAQKLVALGLALILALPPLAAGAAGSAGDAVAAADGNEYVRIKNPWQGYYLYEDEEGKVRYGFTAIDDPAAQWKIEDKDGHQRLQNRATGHYLHSQVVTEANITNALESSDIPAGWTSDLWEIAEAPDHPGDVNIVSSRNPNWIVNFQIQDGYAQANNWAQKPWGSAVWRLEKAETSAPARIANPWNGTYLYEKDGAVAYGNPALNEVSSHWFVEEKDGYKRLRNRATGHYLHTQDVSEQSIAHPIGISDIGPGWTSDRWEIADAGGGTIHIVSSRNPSWIVNIEGAGAGPDGVVRANDWAQPGWGSAVWKLEPAADSTPKRLQNHWTGAYLYEEDDQVRYGEPDYTDRASHWIVEDAADGKRLRSATTGRYAASVDFVGATPLKLLDSPGANATWKQEPAKTEQGGDIEGYVTLKSAADAGSYLNVQVQDGYAQGNNWAQPTWGSAQWKLEEPAPPTGPVNPYVRIKNDWLQLYLYEDNGVAKYGNASLSDRNAQWLIEDADGVKRIKNRATGRYLNAEDLSGPRDALKVSDLAPNSTAGDWSIATNGQGLKLISRPGEADGGPGDGDGKTDDIGYYVHIENKLKHAQYGRLNKTYGSPKWHFVTVTDEAEPSEYVRLKNGFRGTYLYEDGDGKVAYGYPAPEDEASQWRFRQGAQGVLIVNRATGHLISNENVNRDPTNPNGHLDPLGSLDIDPTWGSVQWAVYGIGDSNDLFTFSNDWNGRAVIHVEDGTGFAQASDIPTDWGSAQWIVESVPPPPVSLPEDYIRIRNRASGQYLFENGNNVVLYGTPAANNAASHWMVQDIGGETRIVNRATGNAISAANSKSYLETASPSEAFDSSAAWTVERGPEAGVYLIRSEAEGYRDAYIHTEDLQGYAQYELRSIESRGVQWTFETAPVEAVVVPWDNGPINASTPVIPERNRVRILDAAGKALTERGGSIALEPSSTATGAASEWLPQDYNGRKRFVNRATGRMLSVDDRGKAVVSTDGAGLASQWTVEPYAGNVALRNAASDGRYLTSGGEAVALIADAPASEPWAHWRLEAVASDVRYEAEQAFLTGGVREAGTFVTGFAQEGAMLLFSVNAADAKAHDGILRYRNASGSGKKLSLYVNGLKQSALSFASTGAGWSDLDVQLPLRAGINTVALEYERGDSGGIDVDALTVRDSINIEYRGATLPFTTYEAEHGNTNGTRLAPDRTYKTFASEASGRQAVRLDETGQFVEFKTVRPANALVVRYVLPDSDTGGGIDATLGLYVNGAKRGKLALSSKHSWVYGEYPWTNDPADEDAHRFYDESRLSIGDVPAGATVRLQKDADDDAEYYVIDLIELEQAPDPYGMPGGYLSVADYGAVADDGSDDWNAFRDAIEDAKAQGKGVWIPAGEFLLKQGPLYVDNVTIRGAGMWHTTLRGAGFMAEGSRIRVYDLTLDVDVTSRVDENRESGFDGTFGTGSIIQNVWIEHAKTGIWSMTGKDGVPTDGLYVGGVRIRNTYADGINLTTGTRNTMIEQMHIRNSGDDSIALWSQKLDELSEAESRTSGNTVRFNTVQLPWLADNVAIFGGRDNKIQDNILSDTVGFGAGIALSTRFDPVAFDGATIVERNTLIRTGGREPNWNQNFGAIWIFTGDKPIDADILVRNNTALDSTYQGLYVNGPHPILSGSRAVKIQNYVIDGTGTWGIHANGDAKGAVELDNVIVRNAKTGPVFNAAGSAFELRAKPVNPGSGGNGGGSGGGSGGDSSAGSGSATETATADPDQAVRDAIDSGTRRIEIDLTGIGKSGQAVFASQTLRMLASSLPDAVIVLAFEDMSWTLPANILDVLEAAGYPDAGAANVALTLTFGRLADDEGIRARASAQGFRIAGDPVRFEMALASEEGSTPVRRFGKQFLTRTFAIAEATDAGRSSVVVYDPDTGSFRTVPAAFGEANGRTQAAVKSATNGIYAVAVSDVSFEDIGKHWAREDIGRMANKRIVTGISAGQFAPDRRITRAEMAALIVRALGLDPEDGDESAFRDVRSGAWHAPYVGAAARYGIVRGDAGGNFRPDKEASRAEMAVMLAEALKLTGSQVSQGGASASFGHDGDRIPVWAESSVETLLQAGVMRGKTADSFAPADAATRAEAVVALKRLLQAARFID